MRIYRKYLPFRLVPGIMTGSWEIVKPYGISQAALKSFGAIS